MFCFWSNQSLKLSRNICFLGFKSSLVLNSHVTKPEMLALSKCELQYDNMPMWQWFWANQLWGSEYNFRCLESFSGKFSSWIKIFENTAFVHMTEVPICEHWIRATLYPSPFIPIFSKGSIWIGKSFLGALQLDLSLYSTFVSTKFRIGDYNKSWLEFFSKLIGVCPQPSLFGCSWFYVHTVYLQVLYVKKFSHKFSVSSNICKRNLTINPNLSQRRVGMPNRIHVSLA